MSIINKMLQDLEQRQAAEKGVAGVGSGVSHVAVSSQKRKAYLAWTVAGLSFAALITVLLLVWLQPVAVVNVARRLAPQLILKPALSLHTVPPALPAEQRDAGATPVAQSAQAPENRSDATVAPDIDQDQAPTTSTPPSTSSLGKPSESLTQMQTAPSADLAPVYPEEKKLPVKKSPAKDEAQANQKKTILLPSTEKRIDSGTTFSRQTRAESEGETGQQMPVLKKQIKPLTPQQESQNLARQALGLVQQGQMTEAITLLERALQLAPDNADARQTLIAALLRSGNTDQAMLRAQQGITLDPRQTGFAMILARLQVEKGQQKTAIATLQRSLPYAENQPEYPAFLAALLQREKRHKEAIDQYLQALHDAPDNGIWWMGLGISLQAEQRDAEARQAFTRARDAGSLTPDLQAFVEQRLKQLTP